MNEQRRPEPIRFGYIFWPILAYAGIFYLVEIVSIFIASAYVAFQATGEGSAIDYSLLTEEVLEMVSQFQVEMSALAALISIPVLWFFFIKKDRLRKKEVQREGMTPLYYILAFILGGAACLALNGFLSISGIMSTMAENVEEVTSVMYQGRLPLELITIGIITPIAEEFLFRGIIMERIRGYFAEGSALPIIFSAVMFGCYHGNMIQAIYASILGLILGYTYDKYRKLIAPILVHIGANLISVIGSETSLLNGLFATDALVFGTTAAACLVILGCLYLINSQINVLYTKEDINE